MRKILIVDDSKMISTYMKLALESELGYVAVVAKSLKETKNVLDVDVDFFVALLDLNLGDAPDGEVVDFVLKRGVPSIVLTASFNTEIRAKILSKGVVDYVLKTKDAVRQIIDIVRRLEKNVGLRLLIVDDSALQRRITRNYLELYGFSILEARNGVEGLAVLEKNPDIRLVVTDYEMPKMDGFAFCAKIRELYGKNELAVIGVSSFENEVLSARFIKGGANDFLSKPFQREELYCRIAQNLETLEYIHTINESLQTIQKLHSRMKRDLESAARLQQSLLPQKLPSCDAVRVAALFKPCDELAGDTYNVFRLDERRMGVYIVDVSGHGVPSALLSVTLSRLLTPDTQRSTLLKEECDDGSGYRIASPAEVCAKLNRQFPMDLETSQYFTIVYGILDTQTGAFRYATAGHPGPIHCGRAEHPTHAKSLNMAIGFTEDARFLEDELILAPGDRLFFYTDGATEAENPAGKEFSIERLTKLLQESQSNSLEETLQNVYATVRSWNEDRFKDDLTLCALHFYGP